MNESNGEKEACTVMDASPRAEKSFSFPRFVSTGVLCRSCAAPTNRHPEYTHTKCAGEVCASEVVSLRKCCPGPRNMRPRSHRRRFLARGRAMTFRIKRLLNYSSGRSRREEGRGRGKEASSPPPREGERGKPNDVRNISG